MWIWVPNGQWCDPLRARARRTCSGPRVSSGWVRRARAKGRSRACLSRDWGRRAPLTPVTTPGCHLTSLRAVTRMWNSCREDPMRQYGASGTRALSHLTSFLTFSLSAHLVHICDILRVRCAVVFLIRARIESNVHLWATHEPPSGVCHTLGNTEMNNHSPWTSHMLSSQHGQLF